MVAGAVARQLWRASTPTMEPFQLSGYCTDSGNSDQIVRCEWSLTLITDAPNAQQVPKTIIRRCGKIDHLES